MPRLVWSAPAVAIAVAGALLIWARPPIASAAPAPDPAIERTFLADCAVCHGSDARGTTRGPSLQGVGRASIDYMVTTGQMPIGAPGDPLERKPSPYAPEQQRALVDYVASLTGSGPEIPPLDLDRADLAAGGAVYREQCAACHAWAGDGGALLGREAPAVTSATPTQIAEAIRTGPDGMPAFGSAALDDTQLNNTVAFVHSLRNADNRGGLALGHVGPVAEGAVAIVGALGLLLLVSRWIGTDR